MVARLATALHLVLERSAVPYGYARASAEPLRIAPPRMHATGALQVVSIAGAVAVADLVAQISGRAAWPLGSFAVTATFLLLTAATASLAGAE